MNFELPENLVPLLTQYGAKLIGVLLLLIFIWMVAGWTRRLTSKSLKKLNFDETLTGFFSNASRWVVLLLGILACLGIFGVQTTSFAAVVGSIGLAIGLAFQGTLSNIAAGVMLLIFRPFKVGDFVSVGGETGKVKAISLFTTDLDTLDNRRVILPNGAVFGSTIENVTFNETRRADVTVGVDYSADIDHTRKILESVIPKIEKRLPDGAHQVVLLELGASSVDWQLRVWCATSDFAGVKEAMTRAIKYALDNEGIGIPYPQMDVHLDKINA